VTAVLDVTPVLEVTPVLLELWRTHGLLRVAEARLRGEVVTEAELDGVDLMALGALADAVRAREVGTHVRVRPQPRGSSASTGLALLREIAIARIVSKASTPGATVSVDWSRAGLELAVVALGFGANELVGVLANKRGLPIADDATKKMKGEGMVSVQELQKREIARVLTGARRTFSFDDESVSAEATMRSP
jgi:hypothetical protein